MRDKSLATVLPTLIVTYVCEMWTVFAPFGGRVNACSPGCPDDDETPRFRQRWPFCVNGLISMCSLSLQKYNMSRLC